MSSFERAFADRVGARYAVATANATTALQAALIALGVKQGEHVAVPPLTMSATAIAVLNVGAIPAFTDVDPTTWLMEPNELPHWVGVDLYGLARPRWGAGVVVDAAQTLRPHDPSAPFTSYSFQASKILALGEGGMLTTDDALFAARAREYLSLGYRMQPDQARIDPGSLKNPGTARHYSLGINGRMNDLTAAEGYRLLQRSVDKLCAVRREAAAFYRTAIDGCPFVTPQAVPNGFTHDYWTFAIACDTADRATFLARAVMHHGGEAPWPAWRLTYHEPAFAHLAHTEAHYLAGDGQRAPACPVAESLQPRLLQFQTNTLAAALTNARALTLAVEDAHD